MDRSPEQIAIATCSQVVERVTDDLRSEQASHRSRPSGLGRSGRGPEITNQVIGIHHLCSARR